MEESKYNATVVGKILLTPEIMTLRVDTDEPREKFSAGQYTLLGLYGSENRSPPSWPYARIPPAGLSSNPDTCLASSLLAGG